MENDGVYELVKSLSRHLAKQAMPDYGQHRRNTASISTVARKLQNITYDILLYHQHGDGNGTGGILLDSGLSEIACLHAFAYDLRLQRKLDSANQLERCTRHLQDVDGDGSGDKLRSILRFLLLVGSVESEDEKPPMAEMCISMTTPSCHSTVMDKPLVYGERKWHPKHYNFYYTHFPSELFDTKLENLLLDEDSPFSTYSPKVFEKISSVQDCLVPTYLKKDKWSKKSTLESTVPVNLHGALVLSQDVPCSVDMKLEIPEITENSPTFQLPPRTCSRVSSKSQNSEDEGFIEADTPLSGCSSLRHREAMRTIWEKALEADPKVFYTWESIGKHEVSRQRPFLSECGLQAFDELVASMHHNLSLLDPTMSVPLLRKTTMSELLRDVRYVLLGIISASFGYSKERDEFYPNEGLMIQGISPAALSQLLQEFAFYGTLYWRLCNFSNSGNIHSVYDKGFVFQAFGRGIKCFLHYYHAAILASTSIESILKLLVSTQRFRLQLKYVSDVCNCTSPNGDDFPCGIALLSQLVAHTLEAVDSDYYLVTLSLLRTTCVPYLRFLQKWIYEGVCDDTYGEFLITPNVDYYHCRDYRFWEQRFSLAQSPDVSFLHDLMDSIFVCGKSLNLLKLCCSQHHLFVARNDIPLLSLTFSEKELRQIEKCTLERRQQMDMLATSQKTCRQETVERAQLERMQKKKHGDPVKHLIVVEVKEKIETVRPKEKLGENGAAKGEDENLPVECGNEAKKGSDSDASEGQESKSRHRRGLMRLLSLRGEHNSEVAEGVDKRLLDASEDKMLISPDAGFFEMKMYMTPDTTPSSETPGTTSLLSEDLMSLSVTTADEVFTPSESTDIQLEITEMLNNVTNLILANDPSQQDQAGSDGNANANTNANTIDNAQPTNSNETTAAVANRVQFLLPDENQATGAKRKRSSETNVTHAKESERSKRCPSKNETTKPDVPNIETGEKENKGETSVAGETGEVNVPAKASASEADSLDLILLNAGVGMKSRGRSEHGHSSDSTVQNTLYFKNDDDGGGDGDSTKLVVKSSCSDPVLASDGREFGLVEYHSLGFLKPRGRSVHGHASDSTIQKMMYGSDDKNADKEVKEVESSPRITDEFLNQLLPDVVPYTTKFNFYNLGTTKTFDPTIFSLDNDINSIASDFVGHLLPLPVVMERSLMLPIRTQIELVNKSVVDYFLTDLKLLRHLETMRDYVLLNDGEFAQVLVDQLFDQVAQGVKPFKLLNPKNLTSVLTKALDASLCNDDGYTKNLSFALNSMPLCFCSNVPAPFPGLELQYRTEWPLNLLITPECLSTYNQIFHFILKIRHLHWALTDVFHYLKKSARVKKATFSPQFSQMQLFRHEMHHFVRVIQSYVCNQVLQVSWSELLHDLEHNVRNLDDLMDVHRRYLKRSLTRCMLNPKASPVRLLMQNVFSVTLQFHALMTSSSWHVNPKTGTLEHAAFWKLTSAYKRFQERTAIFYSAVEKCVNLGYQHCWRDLLMRMNFNNFYLKQTLIVPVEQMF